MPEKMLDPFHNLGDDKGGPGVFGVSVRAGVVLRKGRSMRFLVAPTLPLVIAGALVVSSGAAGAQSAQFVGGGFLGDAQNCESQGWNGIIQFTARYLPIGRWGNEDASISMYFADYSVNYRFPNDWQPGQTIGVTEFGAVGDNVFAYLPDPAPQFRIEVPDVVTTLSTEQELHVLFTVENWNALAGCTVGGEIWMRRRS